MPADSTIVRPPSQGGSTPPNLVLGGPPQASGVPAGGGGGLGGLSKNQKIGYGVGAFVIVAGGAYLWAKHKSNATASTTTPVTTPEVIQPASNQDTMPAGNSIGAGAGGSGTGPLATALAGIKTDLDALIAGQSPVNNGGPGALQNWDPNGQPFKPALLPGVTPVQGITDPILAQQVVTTAAPGSPAGQQAVAINNQAMLDKAAQDLGFSGGFASLTPAQQQQAIIEAAV